MQEPTDAERNGKRGQRTRGNCGIVRPRRRSAAAAASGAEAQALGLRHWGQVSTERKKPRAGVGSRGADYKSYEPKFQRLPLRLVQLDHGVGPLPGPLPEPERVGRASPAARAGLPEAA